MIAPATNRGQNTRCPQVFFQRSTNGPALSHGKDLGTVGVQVGCATGTGGAQAPALLLAGLTLLGLRRRRS
jgi:MYXO-CTERM domain-containing protein